MAEPNPRDLILPVVEVDTSGETAAMSCFRGTAFLIGDRGVGLTAEHVIRDPAMQLAVLAVAADNTWTWHAISSTEAHGTEDVAVFKVDDPLPAPYLRITPEWEGSSLSWTLWGFPEDVVNENEEQGQVVFRPDVVFVSGYIRRHLSGVEIPRINGKELYELSGLAGQGCSGAPVIHNAGGTWRVLGVYLGERLAADRGLFVSYAARMDNLADWTPELLGCNLVEEST